MHFVDKQVHADSEWINLENEMKILYIYRNPSLGFSIAKVFRPIEEETRKYAEVDSFYLPVAGAKPWHLWKNIKAACHAVNSKQYDIIHITGGEYYLVPFLKGKFKIVVTVHDLGFFTNFPVSLRTLMLYWLWIKVLKKADKVTCISEKTMLELNRYVTLAPTQLCVIHNPIGNDFVFQRKDINILSPKILHIGTQPNKNLNNTIIALKDFPCRLRVIGKLSNEQKILMNIYHIDFSSASNLSDEEIVREYEQCDIVNFPSFYEGFGMPIIEGQAVGRVIVTSNLSPMNDIAGEGAVFINPVDCSSILKGYQDAVKNWNLLIERGLENVTRFRLETIVQKYLSLYRDLLS